jgi:hypothetical protein
VTLSDLTIAHGRASGSGSDNGGGIYNLGHLTLRRCIIADNHADWDGGGIYNYSTGIWTRSRAPSSATARLTAGASRTKMPRSL